MKKTILFIVLASLCLNFRALAQNTEHNSIKHLKGKVTDQQGQPLPGATVKISNTLITAITDKDGIFNFDNVPIGSTLTVSFIGFKNELITLTNASDNLLIIELKPDANSLDEVQVIGYGTTTKRQNTGSISTVSDQTIQEQPVTNVLSALSGQAAGVFVQTTNGLPGGNINIQIRGQGSITAGSNPLFVIDGVPFNTTVGSLTSLSVLSTGAINGQMSPFNTLNPLDIESISILKDADATAIYGSRGSNGVILITTKKGKTGKTQASFNINEGVTEATNIPKVLNTQQYFKLQQTAYANDGITPSADPNSDSYSPQLTAWLSTKPTNWAKYLLGGKGHFSNADLNISGGNNRTIFNISGNFHSEKTYLPGNNNYDRGGLYANIQHTSENGKFFIQFAHSLTTDNNKLVNPSADIAYDLLLPPNYPIFDGTGNYNFYFGANPVAEIEATAQSKSFNLIDNFLLRYTIIKDFEFKVNSGYNYISVDQTQIFPTVALYPGTPNYTNFGKNSNQSYIIEPQLTYSLKFNRSTLNLLFGGTYQNSTSQGQFITASNFTNEALMQDLGSAASYVTANNFTQYKYVSAFGRVTYNIYDKYIFNATLRRDGSSRFGPGKQFGDFGSLGGAWLWDDESFVKNGLPLISFGKLRVSYGLTGNDQITDYQYLSTYGNSGYVYESIPGLRPTRIANPDFHWETTKKLNVGLDVGFFKNNLLVTVDRFRDITYDQLVNYKIPSITGFTSYEANLPATVKNSGWEFSISSKNIKTNAFSWSTVFNLTLPKNELVNFPGLASSSYANILVVGQDISRIYGYQFVGLDNSGSALYSSQTSTPTNSPNSATDSYYTIGKRSPDLYGGFGNTFIYHNWSLEIFAQFIKQHGLGNLMFTPGAEGFSDYSYITNYWTSGSTNTKIPKPSTYNDFSYFQSTANYFNTSYIRIKNIELSYKLPQNWLSSVSMSQARIFVQAENILSFWNKNIPLLDPESGAFGGTTNNLPPTKSFIIGLQTTF